MKVHSAHTGPWCTRRTERSKCYFSLGETLCRDRIVVERAPPSARPSNLQYNTTDGSSQLSSPYLFPTCISWPVTCARHETKSLFRFRFRFVSPFVSPFVPPAYRVSAGYQIQFLFFSPVILMSCCRWAGCSNKRCLRYMSFVSENIRRSLASARARHRNGYSNLIRVESHSIASETMQRDERASIKNHRE